MLIFQQVMAEVKFLINFCKKALDEKSILSKLSLLVSGNRADEWVRKVMASRETLQGSGFARPARRCSAEEIKDDFRIEKNPEKNEIFILTARR
jgi:hypothetical protein